jgi:hypothetical protein
MDAMPQFSKSQLIFQIFWGKCRECIGRILCLHTARKRENSPSLLLPDTISGFVTKHYTHTLTQFPSCKKERDECCILSKPEETEIMALVVLPVAR